MNKNIKFDDDLASQIQQFANSKTDGNFTQAVDLLIRSALLVDSMKIEYDVGESIDMLINNLEHEKLESQES